MNDAIHKHLEESRKHLLNVIALLSTEEFNFKPVTMEWSIAQVCHHLFLTERATTKAIMWGLKEDKSTTQERKNMSILLDRSIKRKAPSMVEPDVKAFNVLEINNLLNDSREKLLAFLGTIENPSILKEKSVNHPALGDFPLDQWIEQIYLHEQRHTEQIKDIKELLNVRYQ